MRQKLRVRVPREEMHFSWKRFHILQNTVDFVTKVGLWLRLGLRSRQIVLVQSDGEHSKYISRDIQTCHRLSAYIWIDFYPFSGKGQMICSFDMAYKRNWMFHIYSATRSWCTHIARQDHPSDLAQILWICKAHSHRRAFLFGPQFPGRFWQRKDGSKSLSSPPL